SEEPRRRMRKSRHLGAPEYRRGHSVGGQGPPLRYDCNDIQDRAPGSDVYGKRHPASREALTNAGLDSASLSGEKKETLRPLRWHKRLQKREEILHVLV